MAQAFVRSVLPYISAPPPPTLGQSPPTSPSTEAGFFARLYASRFAPLYGEPNASSPQLAALAECLASRQAGAAESDPALLGRLEAFGKEVAGLLVEADSEWGRVFDRGVAGELAADYVEELLGWPNGAKGTRDLLQLLSDNAPTALHS